MNRKVSSINIKYIIITIVFILYNTIPAWGQEITDKGSIKIVQASLNAEGCDCGTADGVPGPKTKAGIEEYQKRNGLEVTGIIDDKLTTTLGLSEDMLKGTLMSDFIARYNTAVEYCNNNSIEAGINESISPINENIITSSTVLDSKTNISFLTDGRNISLWGVVLTRTDNTYDVEMVYEMISLIYAIDDTFQDMQTVIDFTGNFVENNSWTSGEMVYTYGNHDGAIVFIMIPT